MDGSRDRCAAASDPFVSIYPSIAYQSLSSTTDGISKPPSNKTLNRRRFQSPEVELSSATGPGTSRRRNSHSAPVTGRLDEPNDRRRGRTGGVDGWTGGPLRWTATGGGWTVGRWVSSIEGGGWMVMVFVFLTRTCDMCGGCDSVRWHVVCVFIE